MLNGHFNSKEIVLYSMSYFILGINIHRHLHSSSINQVNDAVVQFINTIMFLSLQKAALVFLSFCFERQV